MVKHHHVAGEIAVLNVGLPTAQVRLNEMTGGVIVKRHVGRIRVQDLLGLLEQSVALRIVVFLPGLIDQRVKRAVVVIAIVGCRRRRRRFA